MQVVTAIHEETQEKKDKNKIKQGSNRMKNYPTKAMANGLRCVNVNQADHRQA